MRTIWKFDLEITDQQTVELPKGAELLSVGEQDTTGRTLQLWALVEPEPDWETDHTKREQRTFIIHGTGHPALPGVSKANHVATVISAGGALVWHVFEV